jgi:hypothetical protein
MDHEHTLGLTVGVGVSSQACLFTAPDLKTESLLMYIYSAIERREKLSLEQKVRYSVVFLNQIYQPPQDPIVLLFS